MNMKYVRYNKTNRISEIVLDRPDKRNALNEQVVSELKNAFQLAKDDDECKIVLLKSSSDVFCAGADLQYLQTLQTNTRDENIADSRHLMELFQAIYEFPKIVISVVKGAAIAGGCGLATVTDYCFATETSKFGYTESRIGFVPAIVMVFLLRKIGEGRAREILLSGEVFDANKALKVGLINRVLHENEIDDFVDHFSLNIIDKVSGKSIELIKTMIADIPEMSLSGALDYAANMNAEMRESEDCKKGISSFLNKEKISWS